jgi:hypothetical protein
LFFLLWLHSCVIQNRWWHGLTIFLFREQASPILNYNHHLHVSICSSVPYHWFLIINFLSLFNIMWGLIQHYSFCKGCAFWVYPNYHEHASEWLYLMLKEKVFLFFILLIMLCPMTFCTVPVDNNQYVYNILELKELLVV